MEKSSFLNRKTVGLILRTFAPKPEQVLERVKQMRLFIDKTAAITVDTNFDAKVIFSRIDILVWADDSYQGSDCGQTAEAMQNEFAEDANVSVHEVHHGDLFCGLLNFGVAIQLRNGIDYSVIASTEASSYLTDSVMDKFVLAACNHAKVVGLAITELTESILKGRIANTFAMWHNLSLLQCGGFDLRAAKPKDEKSAVYLKGYSDDKPVFYQLAGVEEVIPLARMVETFGACLAPILPDQGQYVVPDPVKDPELYLRHISKMGTKKQRQDALLAQVGYDFTYLESGVIHHYRK